MIELKNISKSYTPEKVVLNNINITINNNEVIAVLGPSGCGKTTLLKILSSMLSYEGEIINKPLKPSYIFQEDRLIPYLTVKENIEFVLEDKNQDKIIEMLNLLELDDKMNSLPKNLSGGEKKRVNMARSFLYDGDIILADESFSSLDTGLKIRLINEFGNILKRTKKPCVFVTHDLEEAMMIANRIFILDDGNIIEEFNIPGEIPRDYGISSEIKSKILNIILKK